MQIDNQIASRCWRSRGANSNHIPGGTALAAITCCVREGEVIFGVEPVFNERVDMVDIQLTLVEHQIDGLLADETLPALPCEKLLFQRCSLLGTQAGQVP